MAQGCSCVDASPAVVQHKAKSSMASCQRLISKENTSSHAIGILLQPERRTYQEHLRTACRQGGTGWNRVEQGGTGWNRVEQGGTGWNRVEQGGTGWNRVEQGGPFHVKQTANSMQSFISNKVINATMVRINNAKAGASGSHHSKPSPIRPITESTPACMRIRAAHAVYKHGAEHLGRLPDSDAGFALESQDSEPVFESQDSQLTLFKYMVRYGETRGPTREPELALSAAG